MDTMC